MSAPQVSLSGTMNLKINNVKDINNEGVAVNQGMLIYLPDHIRSLRERDWS